MRENLMAEGDWVPDACALPTVEQPLRRAEFDALFANDVLRVTEQPGVVDLNLRADPDAAARAANLAVKETGCCSFFDFALSITDGRVSLTVSTAPAHQPVLAALAARARAGIGEDR